MITIDDIHGAAILIVDDQSVNVQLLEYLLTNTGYTNVSSTTDPRAVAGLHAANRYDLILMDINLPGMNGIDALNELRRDPRSSHIPVLALTANAMRRDIEKGIEAGFFRYLTKPINIDEFNEAINHTLAMIDTQRAVTKSVNY